MARSAARRWPSDCPRSRECAGSVARTTAFGLAVARCHGAAAAQSGSMPTRRSPRCKAPAGSSSDFPAELRWTRTVWCIGACSNRRVGRHCGRGQGPAGRHHELSAFLSRLLLWLARPVADSRREPSSALGDVSCGALPSVHPQRRWPRFPWPALAHATLRSGPLEGLAPLSACPLQLPVHH